MQTETVKLRGNLPSGYLGCLPFRLEKTFSLESVGGRITLSHKAIERSG